MCSYHECIKINDFDLFNFTQDGTLIRFFTNKKVKYTWNNITDTFEKLRSVSVWKHTALNNEEGVELEITSHVRNALSGFLH